MLMTKQTANVIRFPYQKTASDLFSLSEAIQIDKKCFQAFPISTCFCQLDSVDCMMGDFVCENRLRCGKVSPMEVKPANSVRRL